MRAIDKVNHCQNMQQVRDGVNALDDILVPLLVERSGYMTPGCPGEKRRKPGAR